MFDLGYRDEREAERLHLLRVTADEIGCEADRECTDTDEGVRAIAFPKRPDSTDSLVHFMGLRQYGRVQKACRSASAGQQGR